MKSTSVTFSTSDIALQAVYDLAAKKCLENLRDFGGRRVLVEGGGYEKIWLETQPMGGEMYAKRDLDAGLNNQLLFMDNQRADGRIPGSIALENGVVTPQFNKFQGFCFPAPALNLYYLIGRDVGYLRKLQSCLTKFDAYLWKTRDSNGDGCLESWCVTDTGEDGALRYGDAPFWWTEDEAPAGYAVVPIQSMDVMCYSFSARDTLRQISELLQDGQAKMWRQKAEAVRQRLISYLWDDARGACFDRDKDGRVLPTLTHNSLRCMYWGAFTQGMADRFVREHILNEREFWTPFPLPSVAISDPLFRNEPKNCWSGQPEGLTYQRAIRALENYGYERLVTTLGRRLIAALKDAGGVFTQQFDPFTGKPSLVTTDAGKQQDAYGPTMLSLLEYVSRLHGVHMERGEVWFSAVPGDETRYEQIWGDRRYLIESDGRRAKISLGGVARYELNCGLRVVTDENGEYLRCVPIDGELNEPAPRDIIHLA